MGQLMYMDDNGNLSVYKKGSGNRSNSGYKSNNRNNNYHNGDKPKGRSGCTFRASYTSKKGEKKDGLIYGWKVLNKQMLNVVGCPAKNSKTKNENFAKWVVNVFNTVTLERNTYTAFRNVTNGKFTIPDLNWCMNPAAANGGYIGPYYRKKQRN